VFDSRQGQFYFLAPQLPDRIWGSSNLYTMGTGALSLGVKQPRREADHSTPSSAEVKNGGAILYSPIHLHGVLISSLSTGTTALPVCLI
jgi:hypothetical protein